MSQASDATPPRWLQAIHARGKKLVAAAARLSSQPTNSKEKPKAFNRIDVALSHRYDDVREVQPPLGLAENRQREPLGRWIELWDATREAESLSKPTFVIQPTT